MRQLQELLLPAVEQVVGANLLGAYLHGSAVGEGLRPASDLDVLVVVRESSTDAERAALVAAFLAASGEPHGRPLELTVVVRDEVSPWRYPPAGDLLLGEWLRDALEAGAPPPRPTSMPDLAVAVADVLTAGRALAGPPPQELLDAVPVADLVRSGLDGLPGLLADLPHDTRNVVLTLARIWATASTGRVLGKDAAAAWALELLPHEHRPVLAHARRLYRTSTYADEAPWPDELRAGIDAYVGRVLAEIGRAARGRLPGT